MLPSLFMNFLKIVVVQTFTIINCYKRGCTSVKTSSINENREKFQHEWLMKRELAYSKQTGIWRLV